MQLNDATPIPVVTLAQYQGCLLGLALGDALGAPYEGGPLERALWWVLGRTPEGYPRWTDDTQMMLDLAQSLLAKKALDQKHLAQGFARNYDWRRGYGPGTARVLKRIRRGQSWQTAARAVYPTGSFGNGAAMRASVLALFFTQDLEALVSATRQSAEVTHGHELGVEGAVLIAVATRQLLHRVSVTEVMQSAIDRSTSAPFQQKLAIALQWLNAPANNAAQPVPKEVTKKLGNGMSAQTSCVTSLYIALKHLDESFDALMAFCISCGGDVDTIAAMAGTLWGAYNGAANLPLTPIEARDAISDVAAQLWALRQIA